MPAHPHHFRGCVISAVLAALSAGSSHGQNAAVSEYDVKAAFLLNIAKYTDWPSQAFSGPSAPIVIAILGDDPFGAMLDRLVQGRVVNDRTVVVRRSKRVADLRGAHVVFISASEGERAASICASLSDSRALCVGDTAQTGAVAGIHVAIEGGKVAFNVNLPAVRKSGVAISSKLLRLAKSVSGTPVGERIEP